MKFTKITLAIAGIAILGGCASGSKLEQDMSVHMDDAAAQQLIIDEWERDAPKITYIDRKSPLVIEEPHSIPARISNIEIKSAFNKEATMFDLIGMLKALDIHLVVPEAELIEKSIILFDYEGKLGDFLNALGVAYGINFNWNPGNIMTAESNGFYSLTIPQNKEISEVVVSDIKELGAESVKASINTGSISYKAGYRTHQRIINYLERLNMNTSLVSMQLAMINVALDKKDARGIDWSKLNIGLGLGGKYGPEFDPLKFIAPNQNQNQNQNGNNGTTNGTGNNTNGNTSNNSNNNYNNGSNNNYGVNGSFGGQQGNYVGPEGTNFADFEVGAKLGGMGTEFGLAKGDFNLGVAIDYLSTFGKTETTQNLILKTLSGRDVNISSGDVIPYIGEVSSTSNNNGGNNGNYNNSGSTGGAKTEKIETGLEIGLSPFFDAESQLLTIGVEMKVSSLVQMLELKAGNQLGTLTAPHTSEQEFNNVVTMRAGESVLLGGLIVDRNTNNKNSPLFAPGAAHEKVDHKRTAMFIMLRPSVTVFGNFKDDKKIIE